MCHSSKKIIWEKQFFLMVVVIVVVKQNMNCLFSHLRIFAYFFWVYFWAVLKPRICHMLFPNFEVIKIPSFPLPQKGKEKKRLNQLTFNELSHPWKKKKEETANLISIQASIVFNGLLKVNLRNNASLSFPFVWIIPRAISFTLQNPEQ